MDELFKQAVADFFSATELVDLLDISTEDLVHLLEDYIADNEEEIKEAMNYNPDLSESVNEDY